MSGSYKLAAGLLIYKKIEKIAYLIAKVFADRAAVGKNF